MLDQPAVAVGDVGKSLRDLTVAGEKLDTSKETPHNMLLAACCGWLRRRSRVRRGGGRKR